IRRLEDVPGLDLLLELLFGQSTHGPVPVRTIVRSVEARYAPVGRSVKNFLALASTRADGEHPDLAGPEQVLVPVGVPEEEDRARSHPFRERVVQVLDRVRVEERELDVEGAFAVVVDEVDAGAGVLRLGDDGVPRPVARPELQRAAHVDPDPAPGEGVAPVRTEPRVEDAFAPGSDGVAEAAPEGGPVPVPSVPPRRR